MAVVEYKRFDVLLVSLDPTVGSELKKARPCVVVSPDELNECIRTMIIVPMTTQTRAYPTRVPVTFDGKAGEIVLEQIRTIDKSRVVKKLGALDFETSVKVLEGLEEMFS